jgi:hypothetical protein
LSSPASDGFNELYFKRAIARGILFRATEKLVLEQAWYNGGYRANIVAYTLAILGEITKKRSASLDFQHIWNNQAIDEGMVLTLESVSAAVNDDIIHPPQGISNISEWAKKDGCWTRLLGKLDAIADGLSTEFWSGLSSLDDTKFETKTAKQTQRIDNGIEVQAQVIGIPGKVWFDLCKQMTARRLLTPKEIGVLNVASQLPGKVPSEKQCAVLMEILEKARQDGLYAQQTA